ncbi:mutator type transposase, partial [Tanacetum coccineum]
SDKDHGSGKDASFGSENGSASDDDSDSQDSDFLVDPDNMIDDVDVDMVEFRSNIDANVEWVGSKAILTMEEEEFEEEEVNLDELDSGSDSEYEGERKKALKMYHKMNKANASNAESSGTTWKENFYVGLKFSNSKQIKEMVTRVAVEQRRELHLKKNDKVRVRCICRGKVPQFGCEDGDDDSGSKGVVSSGSKGKGQSKEKGQVSGSKGKSNNKTGNGTTWKENFVIGQKFPNSKMIKEMITRVAVEQRRELHLKKNDKKRLRCICRGKVPQFSCEDGDDVSGSKGLGSDGSKGKSQSKEKGQVSGSKGKSINKTKAGGGIKDKAESCPWYLQCSKLPNEETWAESIKPDPKIPLNSLKDQLQKQYKVGISKKKVFRAKKMAQERVEGPLKDGFKAGKMDLLGLDGCFLSSTYPGWILTAVGVDPNNGIYPLAYAIVESENKDS